MKSKVVYKTDAEEDGTGKADTYKADAEEDGTGRGSEGRGQSNFELSINSDYNSRGSADPRESLRKCWISKLALNAHKVSLAPAARSLCVRLEHTTLTT